MIDANRAAYRDEANELLAQLEATLLELEANPGDAELVGSAFRSMHTIKGSGAMFGFDGIASFTHEIESVFDHVRSGNLSVTGGLVTLTLEARDHIKALLNAEFGGETADAAQGLRLLQAFHSLLGEPERATAPPAVAEAAAGQLVDYRIHFRPSPDTFKKGTNPVLLLNVLRELGECEARADLGELPDLESYDLERCYTAWDIDLRTGSGEDAIRDVFLFVEDESELTIEADAAGAEMEDAAPALAATALPGAASQRNAEGSVASIRVTAEKLDSLVNAVGELVTAQARLAQLVNAVGDPELEFVSQEIERLTDQLRNDTMGMRMLPIGATFARFRRLVRDLSLELGKDVELATEGGETELDKNVIEQLNDPMIHVIRNSIDHGIEMPEARRAAGKASRGVIRLSATHSGAHVLIRIRDDGAGLDSEAIRAKAIERGLIEEGAALSEEQTLNLIFEPGFSTAREITEVSGRGVGLDVVKRGIAALRGTVEVRSRPGEGTTFLFKLPLTLAIIEGLLVSVGDDYFVMPMSNILECVELKRKDAEVRGRQRVVIVRNEMVPYVSLREWFATPGEPPEISQVMLAETEHGKFGFVVDRVIGDHQTVIKSLGRVYRGVHAVSGATILGDGAVALILDLDKLITEIRRV